VVTNWPGISDVLNGIRPRNKKKQSGPCLCNGPPWLNTVPTGSRERRRPNLYGRWSRAGFSGKSFIRGRVRKRRGIPAAAFGVTTGDSHAGAKKRGATKNEDHVQPYKEGAPDRPCSTKRKGSWLDHNVAAECRAVWCSCNVLMFLLLYVLYVFVREQDQRSPRSVILFRS